MMLDFVKCGINVVKAYVNGRHVKNFMWEPYTADLSDYIADGENTLTLTPPRKPDSPRSSPPETPRRRRPPPNRLRSRTQLAAPTSQEADRRDASTRRRDATSPAPFRAAFCPAPNSTAATRSSAPTVEREASFFPRSTYSKRFSIFATPSPPRRQSTVDGLGSATPSQYNIQTFLKSTSPRKTPVFRLDARAFAEKRGSPKPFRVKKIKNFDKNRRKSRFPLENARAKKYNDKRDARVRPFERSVDDARSGSARFRRSNGSTRRRRFRFYSKRRLPH